MDVKEKKELAKNLKYFNKELKRIRYFKCSEERPEEYFNELSRFMKEEHLIERMKIIKDIYEQAGRTPNSGDYLRTMERNEKFNNLPLWLLNEEFESHLGIYNEVFKKWLTT